MFDGDTLPVGITIYLSPFTIYLSPLKINEQALIPLITRL